MQILLFIGSVSLAPSRRDHRATFVHCYKFPTLNWLSSTMVSLARSLVIGNSAWSFSEVRVPMVQRAIRKHEKCLLRWTWII